MTDEYPALSGAFIAVDGADHRRLRSCLSGRFDRPLPSELKPGEYAAFSALYERSKVTSMAQRNADGTSAHELPAQHGFHSIETT